MDTIPAKHAEKIGVYDMIIHGASVKVKVIDNWEVVNMGISELQSEFKENMIAGIVAKNTKQIRSLNMIVLCVKSRCLMIQVSRLQLIPQCLTNFLNSKEICFVGPDMRYTLDLLNSFRKYVRNGFGVSAADTHEIPFENSRGMDLRVLAARVFQDPKLLSRNPMALEPLQIIGDKAGVALDKNSSDCVDMTYIAVDALAFSCDEIKHLVGDVYASYLISVKLFDSL